MYSFNNFMKLSWNIELINPLHTPFVFVNITTQSTCLYQFTSSIIPFILANTKPISVSWLCSSNPIFVAIMNSNGRTSITFSLCSLTVKPSFLHSWIWSFDLFVMVPRLLPWIEMNSKLKWILSLVYLSHWKRISLILKFGSNWSNST